MPPNLAESRAVPLRPGQDPSEIPCWDGLRPNSTGRELIVGMKLGCQALDRSLNLRSIHVNLWPSWPYRMRGDDHLVRVEGVLDLLQASEGGGREHSGGRGRGVCEVVGVVAGVPARESVLDRFHTRSHRAGQFGRGGYADRVQQVARIDAGLGSAPPGTERASAPRRPTGRSVAFNVLNHWSAQRKRVEHSNVIDTFTLMQQLVVIPV